MVYFMTFLKSWNFIGWRRKHFHLSRRILMILLPTFDKCHARLWCGFIMGIHWQLWITVVRNNKLIEHGIKSHFYDSILLVYIIMFLLFKLWVKRRNVRISVGISARRFIEFRILYQCEHIYLYSWLHYLTADELILHNDVSCFPGFT